jgi:hypothetical protein
MTYVQITNGQITEGPMNLPKKYKNTSGFNLMADADLLDRGWYPVDYIEIAYDSSIEYHNGYLLDVQPELVVLTSKIGTFTRFQLETNAYNDYHSGWNKLDAEMSRDEEDHITAHHSGIASTADRGSVKRTEAVIYDERIAKRANPVATPLEPQPGEPDYIEPLI